MRNKMTRVRQLLVRFSADQRGGIDDLLQRGLMVVAVLGIAAAVIGYYSGLNTWISGKLTDFMGTH